MISPGRQAIAASKAGFGRRWCLELDSELHYLLGLVTLYRGNTSEARQLLAESLSLCINNQEEVRAARVCTYLADAALWESKLDEAEQWLRQGLAHHADPHQITLYEVERLFVAARLATAQQQYPRAATLFGLADQVHGQVHNAIAGPMRALADVSLATVLVALEAAIFAKAFTAGQQLSLNEAFATILAPTQPAGVLMDT